MAQPGRRKASIFLIALLLTTEAGIFAFARKAEAQVAVIGGPVTVYDGATLQTYQLENLEDIVRIGVVGAGMMALLNSVNLMAQTIAYDTAEQISEGNIGKTTFFNGKSFGDYLDDVGANALGEFIGTLNESGLAPFDLCDPNNFRLKIALALGMIADVKRPEPKCRWQDIKKNYKTFGQNLKSGEALKQFGVAFEPGQSGLGVSVETSSIVLSDIAKRQNAALQDRLEGGGFKSVTELVSGRIKTPSELVRAKALEGAAQGEKGQTLSYNLMGQTLTAAPGFIAVNALNTFTTHLVAKLLKKAIGDGMYWSLYDATCYLGITGCGGVNDAAYGSTIGEDLARTQNSDLITPPMQMDSKYDVIGEFSSCPDEARGLNNCVIDSQFAAAMSRVTLKKGYITVKEAIDQGYLHGDWPLISNSEVHRARNADPYCYANGYCYSNLVKLRKHRILPIGWELAAAKSPPDPIRLSEVVAKFDDCPTAADPNPANHPWCHLIDPNWVLKLPVTQCRMRVNGPTLLSTEAPTRAQYCADTPSCVAEDRYGNCVQGYGYCVREKNIWRLGGTECKAPYASCASFTSRSGEGLLALQNTIDHGICNAENVGCRPYATKREATSTPVWSYEPGFDRVFLNRNVAECDAEGAGCTKVYDKEDLRRNLVLNSSFEEDVVENSNSYPKFWGDITWDSGVEWNQNSDLARTGDRSVKPLQIGATGPIQQVSVEPDMTYTASFYARQDALGGTGQAEVHIWLVGTKAGVKGPVLVDFPEQLFTCKKGTHGAIKTAYFTLKPNGTNWERASCTFTIPSDGFKIGGIAVHPLAVQLALGRWQAPTVWIDDMQIEEGSFVTDYHESAFEGGSTRTLKVPPESLECTGDDSLDVSACKGYSRICRADEVGCDRYTPEAGGTPVTGIVADKDYCPFECVGYQTFRKEKSDYDLETYPKYFIPATAASCSAASVGCTEFTNVDAQTAGGEAKEYFSYIRRCEKPVGVIPTYYTWEGSDTTGYQLKEWHLKPEAVQSPGGGFAPEVSSNEGCDKDLYQGGYASPDCREFYDEGGNISYRLYSKTVVITEDCHPYRMTQMPKVEDKAVATEGACLAQGNGYHWIGSGTSGSCYACEAVGGSYDQATSECTFLGYRPESDTCQAAENGCRLYSGNAGGNVQTVFSDDFEADDPEGWGDAIKTSGVKIATSTESTIVGGHSMRVQRSTSKVWRTMTTGTPGALEEKGIYFVDFWAKGPAMKLAAVQLRNPKTGDQTSFTPTAGSAVSLSGNWKAYSLGPIILNFNPNDPVNGGLVNLEFGADANSATDYWFIDNLVLRKVGSAVSVIQESWKTPPSCDLTNSGSVLPQAQLGCAAYSDRKNEKVSLKSFDKLCRDAAVGCRAFVDTRNNDFTGYEYWNLAAVNTDQTGNPTPVGAPTPMKDGPATVCTAATNTASCRYHKQTSLGIVSSLGASGEKHTYTLCSRQGAGYCYLDGVFICEVETGDPNTTYQCSGMLPDLVTVPPDRSVYLVDDEKYSCDSTQAGCTEVGLPSGSVCKLSQACAPSNGATSCTCSKPTEVCKPGKNCEILNQFKCSVPTGQTTCEYALPDKEPYPELSYQTKYMMMDPARYEGQVCTTDAVGCDEWRSSTKSAPALSYFKNPDGRYCEYRENVKVAGIETSGYYIQGTDEPCDPTYVIGGGYYGIRKNSDPNYHGYAGSCPSDQVGCTEYIDPADVRQTRTVQVLDPGGEDTIEAPILEPQRYYYIKDQSIDYGSCNGQASQKNGCVLLNDTSDQNLYYNSVGTYDDSTAKQYASVPAKPGVCQFYLNNCDAPTQFTGKLGPGYLSLVTEQDLFVWGQSLESWSEMPFNSFNSTYYKDGLDSVQLKDICDAQNEQTVNYYDEAGCYNDADCSRGGLLGKCRLDKKDSNAVINVSRDRICGAWYACKSSTPQWDPRSNTYRDTCDEIGLCDQSAVATNSSPTVDVTSCKHWVTSPEENKILSESLYRNRDISWTGLEYSGYAIPHMFPANVLTQATLDKLCRWPGPVKACSSDVECKYTDDVTYPCMPQNSLGRLISDVCEEGVDVPDGAACEKITAGADPNDPLNIEHGTCYQHKCYQSPFGNSDPAFADEPQPLESDVAGNPLEISCRAYPEPDSPVPGENDVVISYDGGVPTSVKQQFRSAKYCEKGSDCECSYKKAIYTDQTSAKYYGLYNKKTAKGICVGGDFDGQECEPTAIMGMPRSKTILNWNLSCTKTQVDKPEKPAGNCQTVKRTDIVRGLEGFCLERDEATPIYGRESDRAGKPSRACYTWLPVDRIAGQPDLFNQYESATYSIQDSYMCLVPQTYKALHTYGMGDDDADVGEDAECIPGNDCSDYDESIGAVLTTTSWGDYVSIGCVARHDTATGAFGGCGDDEAAVPWGCWHDSSANFRRVGTGNPFLDCPPSMGFLLVDEYVADYESADGGCPNTGVGQAGLCDSGDSNFRYICIPWGSVHTNKNNGALYGKECLPTDVQGYWEDFWPHGICGGSVAGRGAWDNWNVLEDPNNLLSPLLNICTDGFGDVLPQFDETYWSEQDSPRDWGTRVQQPTWDVGTGDRTPTVVLNKGGNDGGVCGNPIVTMGDCWKFDAPVGVPFTQSGAGFGSIQTPYPYNDYAQWAFRGAPSDNGESIGGTLPIEGGGGGYYNGCSVLAQVSKAGASDTDTNKANTENVGGSDSSEPPANSSDIDMPDPAPADAYSWLTSPTPYGLGDMIGIGEVDGTQTFQSPAKVANVADGTDDKTKPYAFLGPGGAGDVCDMNGHCYSYSSDKNTPLSIAGSRMHQLFAKAYDILGWSFLPASGGVMLGKPKGYVPLTEYVEQLDSDNLAGKSWDDLIANPTFSELFKDYSIEQPNLQTRPQVMAPATCDIDGRCGESSERAMMLNSQTNGPLVGSGGSKRVSFKFFGDAGYGTEPIRDVQVIWDVNDAPGRQTLRSSGRFLGMFKNHRGFAIDTSGNMRSLCDPKSGFGFTSDACDDSAPFTFIHNYTCNSSSPHCEDSTDKCWEPHYPEADSPGACVYRPAVYILNNWGICTGTCGQANSPAGTLCSSNGGSDATIEGTDVYKKFNGGGDECDIENDDNVFKKGNRPFVTYGSIVAVYPE